MKWLLDKEFIVPFALTFLLAGFIDNRWILLAVVVFFYVYSMVSGMAAKAQE